MSGLVPVLESLKGRGRAAGSGEGGGSVASAEPARKTWEVFRQEGVLSAGGAGALLLQPRLDTLEGQNMNHEKSEDMR